MWDTRIAFDAYITPRRPSSSRALPYGLDNREVSTGGFDPSRLTKDTLSTAQNRGRSSVLPLKRSAQKITSMGLGDQYDVIYDVVIQIGNISTPVQLDTGSSDLWVITDACKTQSCNSTTSPRYPSASVSNPELNFTIDYGDSLHRAMVSGSINSDSVQFAGFSMSNQLFGAVNVSNTSVHQFNDAGIVGFGFPLLSAIERDIARRSSDLASGQRNLADQFFSAMAENGTLLSRLAVSGHLEQAMFSLALQRDVIDISSNPGRLTLGGLPNGIDNKSLTWVPVRLYTEENGGAAPPSFAPSETYPLYWEVMLDAVYFDGKKLPNPTGNISQGVSALIDSGTSFILGPQNNIQQIFGTACDTQHTLAFEIGGKMFPVDPRDLLSQQLRGNPSVYNACVASDSFATDPAQRGALFSWVLGDTFFKSNLIAFYFGNLTHPSADPPRIGFLSTVSSDASKTFTADIKKAQEDRGAFTYTSDSPYVAATATATARSSASGMHVTDSIYMPLFTSLALFSLLRL